MKAFKSTKCKVEEHIQHARKATTIRSKPKGMIVTTFPQPKPYIPPVLKQVDEDVWSVEWGSACVEFSYSLYNEPFVAVYPNGEHCGVAFERSTGYEGDGEITMEEAHLPEMRSRVTFHTEEEVKTMAEECKKKLTKKEGKEAKKKDYYAGKEVKAQ